MTEKKAAGYTLLGAASALYDRILAGRHEVEYPCPGRKLEGVVSVQKRGSKPFCKHAYERTGYHAEIIEDGREPERVLVSHYECRKCGRRVNVLRNADNCSIGRQREKTAKKQAKNKTYYY